MVTRWLRQMNNWLGKLLVRYWLGDKQTQAVPVVEIKPALPDPAEAKREREDAKEWLANIEG